MLTRTTCVSVLLGNFVFDALTEPAFCNMRESSHGLGCKKKSHSTPFWVGRLGNREQTNIFVCPNDFTLGLLLYVVYTKPDNLSLKTSV